MDIREITIHRARDVDAALRSNKRVKLMLYVFFRQISKILKINENSLKSFIPGGRSTLKGYKFITRSKTIDFLFFSRFYEPETTKFLSKIKGGIFLDIGAHLGRMSIMMTDNFKEVYAFEPQPSTYKNFVKNIENNNLKNIHPFNIAVSDNEKKLRFLAADINTGAAKVSESGNLSVNAKTLDSIISKNKINPAKVSAVKIDVEGHEKEVVAGAKDFLRKTNSPLIIECFHLENISKLLASYGYSRKRSLDFHNHLFIKR